MNTPNYDCKFEHLLLMTHDLLISSVFSIILHIQTSNFSLFGSLKIQNFLVLCKCFTHAVFSQIPIEFHDILFRKRKNYLSSIYLKSKLDLKWILPEYFNIVSIREKKLACIIKLDKNRNWNSPLTFRHLSPLKMSVYELQMRNREKVKELAIIDIGHRAENVKPYHRHHHHHPTATTLLFFGNNQKRNYNKSFFWCR